MRIHAAATTAVTMFCLTTGCATEPAPGPEGPLEQVVRDRLGDLPVSEGELEYRIHDLAQLDVRGPVDAASCDDLDQALADVCARSAGAEQGCWATTTFFNAHATPRCAIRFELQQAYQPSAPSRHNELYLLDVAGDPISGRVPSCGDGDVDTDAGEACDDGNLENFDGCDRACQPEPFNGCEAVIERVFADADVADVPAARWTSPHSHLMINRGQARRVMDAAGCAAAEAAATASCRELETMPFVGSCGAMAELHGDACSIRLMVSFDQVAPDTGVFTTALPGVLAFTLR